MGEFLVDSVRARPSLLEALDFEPHWQCESGIVLADRCMHDAVCIAVISMTCEHRDRLLCEEHLRMLRTWPADTIWECIADGAEGRLIRIERLPRG